VYVSDIELANFVRILTETRNNAANNLENADDYAPYIEELEKAIANTEAVYVLKPKSSNAGTIYWYYIKETASGNYCLANPNASGVYKNAAGVAEFVADDDNYLWAFVADKNGGFQVYNKGYDAYLYTMSASAAALKADKAEYAGVYEISVDNDNKALAISEDGKYWGNNSGRVRVRTIADASYWKIELAGTETGSLTSIIEIETEASNGTVEGIFDLTGRKIEKITKPGIYIINGKKTLVK
jgi:hypothetical protein